MIASTRSPASRARPMTPASSASDWSIVRLTLRQLCSALADMNTPTSSKCSRSSSAPSRPTALGISTLRATPAGTSIAVSTSRASASCGMTSGRTKLVTSMRFRPVRASWSMSATLSAVGIRSGSF